MPIEDYYKGLLKPCPACGAKIGLPFPNYSTGGYWAVECCVCDKARATGPTLLSAVVTWQNLCVPKNKRLSIMCPNCGSAEVECYSFVIERNTAFHCKCRKCNTSGPYVYSNKLDALPLFTRIVNFEGEIKYCSSVVEVNYKAVAITTNNNDFWDIEALEKAIIHRDYYISNRYFWDKDDISSNSVRIYKYLEHERYPVRSKRRKWTRSAITALEKEKQNDKFNH